MIQFQKSKNNQLGLPRSIRLLQSQGNPLCPVSALLDFSSVCPQWQGHFSVTSMEVPLYNISSTQFCAKILHIWVLRGPASLVIPFALGLRLLRLTWGLPWMMFKVWGTDVPMHFYRPCHCCSSRARARGWQFFRIKTASNPLSCIGYYCYKILRFP